MDLQDLRVFAAVAETGAMNRAAGRLNTVQSAVTERIQQLEARLGITLFRRNSRGVTLTPAGHRLLPFAAAAERLVADARRAVLDEGAPAGPLVIGSLETTAALRLAPLLADFARRYPAVELTLRAGTTAELVEGVLQDRLEGAFVCGPVRHPALVGELGFRERLVLVTPPAIGSPKALARQAAPRLVVLRAGCSYRQRLQDILARQGILGPRVQEFGTLEMLIAGVAGGLGCTLLPEPLVAEAARQGRVRLHALPSRDALVDTLFIRRRDGLRSSALTAFLAMARPAIAAAAA
jgi:LysR family transcriptional regulator, cell division regulator